MSERLPKRVRALLRRLEAFEELELLLVFAEERGHWLRLDDLAQRVRIARTVDATVAKLVSADLIHQDGEAWRLSADPEVQASAPDLLRLYRDDPIPIVQALTEDAIERVRSAAARTFADAFVWRRGGDG